MHEEGWLLPNLEHEGVDARSAVASNVVVRAIEPKRRDEDEEGSGRSRGRRL